MTADGARPPVFPDGSNYVRITLQSLRHKAASDEYDRATRVEFAAAGWCNRDGHAQFRPSELACILAVAGRPASPSEVSRAIARAKDRGAIGQESQARCLVVDHLAVNQGKGQLGCIAHGVRHLDQSA